MRLGDWHIEFWRWLIQSSGRVLNGEEFFFGWLRGIRGIFGFSLFKFLKAEIFAYAIINVNDKITFLELGKINFKC